MRASLLRIIRARMALWHTRQSVRHIARAEALFNGAPLVLHNVASALAAVAFVALALHFQP